MSLGGIAIAIGAMIDAAIVMIENAHKHLERAAPERPRVEVLIEAAAEVGPALFFSLLIITVSFLPIFTLESQEGRLFSPLAFTKTFAMAAAALLSVTLVPALMVIFVRGRIVPEHSNPINRFLIWIYRPVIKRGAARQGAGDPGRAGDPGGDGLAGAAARHRVHAEPERGHAALYADHAARAFRSPRRPNCCRPRTASSARSRRWSRSTARPAAPRPRPIRRRWRCSRPSSI